MPLMPESDPVKASMERKIKALERELRALQKKGVENESLSLVRSNVVFSFPGTPVADELSGPYIVPDLDAAIQRIDFSANAAGAGESTLCLFVEGVLRYELTIPAGQTLVVEDGVFLEVGELDAVTMKLTKVGAGLLSVVVNVHFYNAEVV